MDEIPPTLGFDFQMFKAKDVELPNSSTVVVIGFDEIPLILGVDFKMFYSHVRKVSPFHVIFDVNRILIATQFDRGSYTIIIHLGLKEFLEKCHTKFQVYI